MEKRRKTKVTVESRLTTCRAGNAALESPCFIACDAQTGVDVDKGSKSSCSLTDSLSSHAAFSQEYWKYSKPFRER